jgi:hypothetical protein
MMPALKEILSTGSDRHIMDKDRIKKVLILLESLYALEFKRGEVKEKMNNIFKEKL